MKIDIAPDSVGSENVLRQRRNQQTATNAWLRQMEMAMLVQPSPPQGESRGSATSRPDASSVVSAGRDAGLTVNTRAMASRAEDSGVRSANTPSASSQTMQRDSRSTNDAPVGAVSLGQGSGALSSAAGAMARSPLHISSAMGEAFARPNSTEACVGAQTEADVAAGPSGKQLDGAQQVAGTAAAAAQPLVGASAAAMASGQRADRVATQPSSATEYRIDLPTTRPTPPSQRIAIASLSMAGVGGPVGTDAAATEATEAGGPPESAPEQRDPPGKRAMHLTRDGSGVQVSIRDMSLDATAQWALIGRLAAQLQGAGLNLRGLTINGDRRYERIDEDLAQLGDLFVTCPPNPDTAPKTNRLFRGDDHAG